MFVSGCLACESQRHVAPDSSVASTLNNHAGGVAGPAVNALSFRFEEAPADSLLQPVALASPMSLTASDGTGLKLVALDVQGVVQGPLAFTQLKVTFENPENRRLEGRFKISMPPSASISRFAMKIKDRWQEGEVVERQAARRAYEDFLHRRQDPALLEQQGGNEFSARIFPIEALARKEVIISYAQELAQSQASYRVPLHGLPKLDRLSLRVIFDKQSAQAFSSNLGGQKSEQNVVEVEKKGWIPDRDFELAIQPKRSHLGLRHDNLVVFRVQPDVRSQPEEIASLFILVDTSASRALNFSAQTRLVQGLLEGLKSGAGPELPLGLACFDQEVKKIYVGPIQGFGPDQITAMKRRRALGASNLQAALDWLASEIKNSKQSYKRVLIVSDGVATAGEVAGDKLRQAVLRLGPLGVKRLDALVLGGIRNESGLKALTTAGLKQDGTLIEGRLELVAIARKLTSRTRSHIRVSVDNANWVWPEELNGVQTGDELLVYADLPAGKDLKVSLGGQKLSVDHFSLASVEAPLLQRAWVNARIQRLLYQRDTLAGSDQDMRDALQKQVVDLSVKHRVLSPYTALLILETEQDYQRFNIDRRALSDILGVGPQGVVLVKRTGWEPPVQKLPPVSVLGKEDQDSGEIGDEPGGVPITKHEAEDPDGGVKSKRMRKSSPAEHRPKRSKIASNRGAPVVVRDPADEEKDLGINRKSVATNNLSSRGPSRVAVSAQERPKIPKALPYEGKFAKVMSLLNQKKTDQAYAFAFGWNEEEPGDVMAKIALGEVWEKMGDKASAARAYGSLIDLFPSRADIRRFAGQRLERLADAKSIALAEDSYKKAVEQRPDHPAGHHLLAFVLLKRGQAQKAFDVLLAGLGRSYPSGRFAGVERILKEDLGLAAAVWRKAEPDKGQRIEAQLKQARGRLENSPSLRFVLIWETDANDVDFHIHDGQGGHAYYSNPTLPSGGELYADVTTGYGPECFTIRNLQKNRAYPYRLQAHYYSRGPMGYGMGKLQIIQHDGKGGLSFVERPFVVMKDGAYLDLGIVKKKLE
jgi:tetratricopeptide (TPR) repeat protein